MVAALYRLPTEMLDIHSLELILGTSMVPAWLRLGRDHPNLINPPDTGLAERFASRLRNGHYLLTPISPATVGHGSHGKAILHKDQRAEPMAR